MKRPQRPNADPQGAVEKHGSAPDTRPSIAGTNLVQREPLRTSVIAHGPTRRRLGFGDVEHGDRPTKLSAHCGRGKPLTSQTRRVASPGRSTCRSGFIPPLSLNLQAYARAR